MMNGGMPGYVGVMKPHPFFTFITVPSLNLLFVVEATSLDIKKHFCCY